MKTILVSLTAAVAIVAGVYAYLLPPIAGETAALAEKSERIRAKETGVAMARELDRLQTLRKIQNEIPQAEVDLALADALVKDWTDETAGKYVSQTEEEVMKINSDRAKTARERLDWLRAQVALLAAN